MQLVVEVVLNDQRGARLTEEIAPASDGHDLTPPSLRCIRRGWGLRRVERGDGFPILIFLRPATVRGGLRLLSRFRTIRLIDRIEISANRIDGDIGRASTFYLRHGRKPIGNVIGKT